MNYIYIKHIKFTVLILCTLCINTAAFAYECPQNVVKTAQQHYENNIKIKFLPVHNLGEIGGKSPTYCGDKEWRYAQVILKETDLRKSLSKILRDALKQKKYSPTISCEAYDHGRKRQYSIRYELPSEEISLYLKEKAEDLLSEASSSEVYTAYLTAIRARYESIKDTPRGGGAYDEAQNTPQVSLDDTQLGGTRTITTENSFIYNSTLAGMTHMAHEIRVQTERGLKQQILFDGLLIRTIQDRTNGGFNLAVSDPTGSLNTSIYMPFDITSMCQDTYKSQRTDI